MDDVVIDAGVAVFCARQLGLVTLEQARSLGLTVHMVRHRVDAGQLVPVRRGVYRDPAMPAVAEQRILGAVLGAGDGAFASHDTACWLWELPLPDVMCVEVSTSADRRPRYRDVVWHRTNGIRPREIELARGVPVCPADRAIADVSGRYGVEDLAAMVATALDLQLTTVPRFTRLVATLPPVRGRHRDRLRAALRVVSRSTTAA